MNLKQLLETIREGKTTGGDPQATGERIGRALASGNVTRSRTEISKATGKPRNVTRRERVTRVMAKISAKHSGKGGRLKGSDRQAAASKESGAMVGKPITKSDVASHSWITKDDLGKPHTKITANRAVQGKSEKKGAKVRDTVRRAIGKGQSDVRSGLGDRLAARKTRRFGKDLSKAIEFAPAEAAREAERKTLAFRKSLRNREG